MSWRSAFLDQARSDFEIMERLKSARTAECHHLHYLQMCTEKLAKAIMTAETSATPPSATHSAFVTALRVLKKHSQLRQALGYPDKGSFYSFIDSLLDAARRIEELAPWGGRWILTSEF